MGTLASVVRDRKSQLRLLKVASRKLDASQETLEREVNRLLNRKKSVPELADAERLTNMIGSVNTALDNMVQVLSNVSSSWANV